MFQVTTVDMQKPPPDFRTNFEATHPPILIDNGLSVLENEKIERHIMKNVPGGHNLFIQVCNHWIIIIVLNALINLFICCFVNFQDKEVATLIENLYSKLKLVLVRKDEQKSANLLSHLTRIDSLLAKRSTRFLTGDTMCCFDCELMPRLQHIRVAAKYFVDFEIPVRFRNNVFFVWLCLFIILFPFCFSPHYVPFGVICITCTSWMHSHNLVQQIKILSIIINFSRSVPLFS